MTTPSQKLVLWVTGMIAGSCIIPIVLSQWYFGAVDLEALTVVALIVMPLLIAAGFYSFFWPASVKSSHGKGDSVGEPASDRHHRADEAA